MTDAAAHANRLNRLAVLTAASDLHNEFGPMVIETLSRMGVETALFQNTTDGLDRWPAVLMIGDVFLMDRHDAYFRSLTAHKPRVLFWFLEPLAPDRTSKRTRDWARRLGSLYRKPRPPGFKPKSNAVIDILRRVCVKRLKHGIERDTAMSCTDMDDSYLFFMMYRINRLLRHFKNPWIDKILTSTVSRREHLKQCGIDADFVPVGWTPAWGRFHDVPRDIDVLFLGHRHKKIDCRTRVIAAAQEMLAPLGFSVTVVDRDCYGQQRTDLLNRTKILLDVVRAPWELPGMRLLIGLSCGALVVSSGFSGDGSPYRPGTHFVAADKEALADTLLYYLNNEDARRAVADNGREFVTRSLTLENSLRAVLAESSPG